MDILSVIEMSKRNKISIAVGSALVTTIVAIVGYRIVRRAADWNVLREEIASIPWDFEDWKIIGNGEGTHGII